MATDAIVPAVFPRFMRSLVRVEECLNLLRSTFSQQGEREKNPGFLRIEFVRRDEAKFVFVDFDFADDRSRRHS